MTKRGGSRKHPADCNCGNCPQIGRRKAERLSNPATSEKILRDVRAEELEKALIAVEVHRLNIDLDSKDLGVFNVPEKVKTEPLFRMLDRLKCHARGNPRDTVNHLHKEPMNLNVNLSIAEVVRKVRERKEQYERSR